MHIALLGTSVAAVVVVAAVAPPTAVAQDAQRSDASSSDPPVISIPIFERKHSLVYQLGDPPVAVINPVEDLDRPTQTYVLSVDVEEQILRGERKTSIRVATEADLLLARKRTDYDDVRFGETGSSHGENRYTLESYLVRMSNHRSAGSTVEQCEFSLDGGLVRIDQMGERTTIGMADAFVGTQSLLAAVSQPSRARCRNGAVLNPPKHSPILNELRLNWVDYALLGVLPPMPESAMATSQTWQAGFFVQPSLYAEPTLIRGQFRFVSFDAETGLAWVKWEGHTASLPIHPVPGVHHVDENAITRIDVAGSFRIHVRTGWIHSGNLQLTSMVINPDHQDVRAEFSMDVHLSAREEPEEIRRERENRVGPADDDSFEGIGIASGPADPTMNPASNGGPPD